MAPNLGVLGKGEPSSPEKKFLGSEPPQNRMISDV